MEDQTQRLPHDVLADVLLRLQKTSPRSLAASRSVCKAWLTLIDTRRLLADLLPHALTGIFFGLNGETLPRHFSVATSAANIAPFDYLDTRNTDDYLAVRQHCNGLLLLVADDYSEPEEAWVVNPATQQWAHLPIPPPMCTPGMEDMYDVHGYMDCHDQYLVFNPMVSPHYEVFLVKYVPFIPLPDSNHLVALHIQETEWPPSTFVLLVYSSKTNQWEERPFVREGEAAGIIDDMLQACPSDHRFAAYWQEALYFHQRGLFMRYIATHILIKHHLICVAYILV
ncbi:hypothetical protein ZWY2020_016987 [Hordeum vulgare]|nr:hypothetical protein ZWY2020_016987 [Hordeum vulgare]